MGIGTSIFLIAVGAILYFAVNVDISGLEVSTIGLILMIVGILGLVISLYPDVGRLPARRRDDGPAGRPRARHLLGVPGPPGAGRPRARPAPGARRGDPGTWRHSVKWCARITNATRASSPAAAQVWPAALGQPEGPDDVAPVVLDLEQPCAAGQPVVEPAHLLARLQLDRHRLGDERGDVEVARRARRCRRGGPPSAQPASTGRRRSAWRWVGCGSLLRARAGVGTGVAIGAAPDLGRRRLQAVVRPGRLAAAA